MMGSHKVEVRYLNTGPAQQLLVAALGRRALCYDVIHSIFYLPLSLALSLQRRRRAT